MGKKSDKPKDEIIIMKIKSNSSSASININKHIHGSNKVIIINDYTSLDATILKNIYCVIDICTCMDEEINDISITIPSKEDQAIEYDFVSINSSDDEKNLRYYRLSFITPQDDIIININTKNMEITKQNNEMEEINKMEKNGVIDYFEIPDELAKELSDNLIKQTIRQRTLVELVNDPERYNSAEKLLIPIVSKVEAIKVQITNQYVPEKYRSSEYIWNYDGYEVDGNKVQIHKV